jgi:hypothetical protein
MLPRGAFLLLRGNDMPLFGETKPRKAKYGFKAYLSTYNLLKTTELIRRVMGEEEEDGVWFMVMNHIMGGSPELLIYIDDQGVYEAFKQANAAS